MRLPKLLIPVLVLLSLTAGYGFRTIYTRPTTVQTFAEGSGARATFIVDGVRCKGTAMFFSSLYEDTPGIMRVETFAGEHMAVFTYDPKTVTQDRIRAIMEAPIPFDDGTTSQVFRCISVR
ncbi:MAG TPA: hypothetical protein VJA21_15615 [Verrucomicrobiae bacterium]